MSIINLIAKINGSKVGSNEDESLNLDVMKMVVKYNEKRRFPLAETEIEQLKAIG